MMSARIPRGIRSDTSRIPFGLRKDSAPRPLYPTRPDPTRPVLSGYVVLFKVQDLLLPRHLSNGSSLATAGAGTR